MTTDTSRPQPESSAWWTPRRTKLAGVGGVLGGLALVGLASMRPDAVIRSSAVGLSYSAASGLLLLSLFAAHERYGPTDGRVGRFGAIALGLLLVGVTGFTLFFSISPLVFGIVLTPFGLLYGLSFYGLPVAAALYGYDLWRETSTSRLAAGALLLTLPAALALLALAALDWPIAQPQVPVYLAFVTLGYELVTTDDRSHAG